MCITGLMAVSLDPNLVGCKQLTFLDTAILSTVKPYGY